MHIGRLRFDRHFERPFERGTNLEGVQTGKRRMRAVFGAMALIVLSVLVQKRTGIRLGNRLSPSCRRLYLPGATVARSGFDIYIRIC